MNVTDRFLKYVCVDTESDENCEKCPSSDIQFNLAKMLTSELIDIGVKDAVCDENCYVYGHIPATAGCENAPALGLIAHMDTAPDFNGYGVKPQILKNYRGGDIVLGNSGRKIAVSLFPHLNGLIGEDIITTDGTSLLGGDDKAGIAEIMTAVEGIIKSGKPHGKIAVCFTPDEEVGRGADLFPVEKFGCDFAYTVDGGSVNIIEWENFNAASAVIEINGFNVHPGSAKDTMINAALVAFEINGLLPVGQTPRDTDGYNGFYHLIGIEGNVEKAKLAYIIRDHDDGSFEMRKGVIQAIVNAANRRYGEGTADIVIKEQYRNMASVIKKNYHLVENALEAVKKVGLEAKTEPVRGGTDGARLSFMGLPCPNLGTGVYAMHGPCEHAVISEMEKSVEIISDIVYRYSAYGK